MNGGHPIAFRDATIEDCDVIGLITVTASHSAFIGRIPEDELDLTWNPADSAARWRETFDSCSDRGQRIRLAIAAGTVVGWAWSRPWADTTSYDASVGGLYVRPTWHRLGIGRGLLRDAVAALSDRGCRSLEIGCVRENPGCGFYRHLGGVEIGRRPVRVDRFDTVEILFGWQSLDRLLVDLTPVDSSREL